MNEIEEIMKEHNLTIDKAIEIVKIVQVEKITETLGDIRYLMQETKVSVQEFKGILDSVKWEIGNKIGELNQTFREPISQ